VVHLDLRNRTNVLRDAQGRPVLIDFGSALVFRPGSLAARWLLPLFAAFDRRALGKWETKQRRRKRLSGSGA
jgi:serine/threonine protein kinase